MQSLPAAMTRFRVALVRALAPVLLATGGPIGCNSGEDGTSTAPADAAAPEACTPHVPNDTLPANVSFRMDIMPVFFQSCALYRYCHNHDGSQGELYLGPNSFDPEYPPGETTFAEVRAGLVDAPAVRAVAMMRVAPGFPEQSFLMHKVDTDQNCSDILCTNPLNGIMGTDLCGDKMPPNKTPRLDMASADRIRAWILDGAPDN
jgi:hypothetical protein